MNRLELQLVYEIVSNRMPGLIADVVSIGGNPLSQETREAIRMVLLDELLEKGLDGGDEANSYGSRINECISALGEV